MTSMTSTHPSDADPAAPLSRRAVVAGVGGVAAAGLLTACGGATPAPAPAPAAPAPAAPSAEPSAATSGGATLAAASSIPVGGGTVFAEAKQRRLAAGCCGQRGAA